MKSILLVCSLVSLVTLSTSQPQWGFEGEGEVPRVFPTYGPEVERDGFCPREPRQSLCDTNFCNQDNHCEESKQKCCPVDCGGLMCVDSVPGRRRAGHCPDFWKVPVEHYPEVPVNQCEIDDDCLTPIHKCCGTDTSGIRKCVNPLSAPTS